MPSYVTGCCNPSRKERVQSTVCNRCAVLNSALFWEMQKAFLKKGTSKLILHSVEMFFKRKTVGALVRVNLIISANGLVYGGILSLSFFSHLLSPSNSLSSFSGDLNCVYLPVLRNILWKQTKLVKSPAHLQIWIWRHNAVICQLFNFNHQALRNLLEN